MRRKIFKVFILFLLVQIVFSIIYYRLYKNDNRNFFFLKEILSTQVSKVKQDLYQEILIIDKEYSNIRTDSTHLSQTIGQVKLAEGLIENISFKELQENIFGSKLTNYQGALYDMELIDPLGRRGMAPPGKQGDQLLILKFECYDKRDFSKRFSLNIETDVLGRGSQFLIEQEQRKILLKSLESYRKSKTTELKGELNKVLSTKNKKEKELRDVELENTDVWTYWDFLYFSFTKVSNSDILPNSSFTRVIVVFQILIEVFIVGFLISIVVIKRKYK
ncbi:ion channel [Flagellimonas sp.]|uniref:ion channel n=1 Tax=Flagellimonas sp. TaxID=2058762 RepID=UPI003BAEFD30